MMMTLFDDEQILKAYTKDIKNDTARGTERNTPERAFSGAASGETRGSCPNFAFGMPGVHGWLAGFFFRETLHETDEAAFLFRSVMWSDVA